MFSIKKQIGNQAENIALNYLIQQGLVLIEQNYLTKVCEIDIIMLDKAEQSISFCKSSLSKKYSFWINH